jgi:MtN3 and saliva related transmembrane protein
MPMRARLGSMNGIEMIGYLGALLTTVSFLPQLMKIWRTKRADDLSVPAFSAFFAGVICWLVYSIEMRVWPMIAANSVTVVLAGGVVALALRYRRRA